ncbi:MAG: hypothetical protein AABY15_06100 [Nanoarchaeota archaeon]
MDNNLNPNNNPSGKKMDPTRELYEKLVSEVYKYKLEEREMALDRYRRADAQMDTSESFILMGKNAIDFLKQAASASDGIASLAKEIKSIVYKEETSANVEVNLNDATKKALIDAIKEDEEKDTLPDENLEDKE